MAESVSGAVEKVVEDEGDVKKKEKIDRHCAFCLTLVPGAEVKTCSKCKRRAYCSKECQTADWKSPKEKPAFNGKIHGYGQGHKNWCGIPYGEEDLDWKVAPISGKRLGIVALRDLPPLYRIIVEGLQAEPVLGKNGRYNPYHPEMDDLVPFKGQSQSASFSEMFKWTVVNSGFGRKVGLRFSRANHSCDPNACYTISDQFRVLIMCSNRAIKEGEEICFAYMAFNAFPMRKDEYLDMPPEFYRDVLLKNWGIVCPPSCPCRDLEKFEMVKTGKELYQECKRDWERKNVLPKMEKVIEIAEKVGCSALSMCILYHRAFKYAQHSLETTKVKENFEKQLKIFKAIFHPDDEMGQVENELKDLL